MSSSHQIIMVSLEQLVSQDHQYRKFNTLFDFKLVQTDLLKLESKDRYKGYGILRLFKCLLLQFMEDLSDRELERYLSDNNAAKWFCGFSLMGQTPDHTVFSRVRSKIGTKVLSQIFAGFRIQLQKQGYMSEAFTFIDASHLISKVNLWKERDKLVERKEKGVNNKTLPKVAIDKQAMIGCKGKDKFWYGYKKHISVDISSGMINKVAITSGNVTDAKGSKHVMPSDGIVYGDKGYCSSPAKEAALKKGVKLCAIKRNNMKGKDFKVDKYYSRVRSPFERVFSKDNKVVRYLGIAKNQFAEFMRAICFNLRRLVVLSYA